MYMTWGISTTFPIAAIASYALAEATLWWSGFTMGHCLDTK
jgi:hypothetical protein